MVCKMPKTSKNRQKTSEFQAFFDFFSIFMGCKVCKKGPNYAPASGITHIQCVHKFRSGVVLGTICEFYSLRSLPTLFLSVHLKNEQLPLCGIYCWVQLCFYCKIRFSKLASTSDDEEPPAGVHDGGKRRSSVLQIIIDNKANFEFPNSESVTNTFCTIQGLFSISLNFGLLYTTIVLLSFINLMNTLFMSVFLMIYSNFLVNELYRDYAHVLIHCFKWFFSQLCYYLDLSAFYFY